MRPFHLGPQGPAAQAVEAAVKAQVLFGGEAPEEMGPGGRQVDALPEPARLFDHIQPQHPGLPGIRMQQGGQDGDEGSLAGAVGPQDAEDGPGNHLQVHLAQHFLPGTEQPFPIGLADALGKNGWLHNYRLNL